MAVLPSEDTVTAVVAITYITPAERAGRSADQGRGSDKVKAKHADGTDRRTFIDHRVVEEAPGRVFHRQAVPQREVVDGEQVVFVGRSQELSVDSKIQLQVFYFEKKQEGGN